MPEQVTEHAVECALPTHAPLHDFWQLVHGPLAHWAHARPHATALQTESRQLSFAQLHALVGERSAALVRQHAPAMRLIDPQSSTLDTIVEFLAIIHSGRCAALADPEWPSSVLERTQAWMPQEASTLHTATSTSPFYTGFTSGSSGWPKGFMRHHHSWTESFRVSLADFGEVAAGRMLSPGRMSHSLFLFGVMQGLWCGSGAVVQERFSALRCLDTLREASIPCLVAVPSQLLLMMQWATQRQLPPVESVRFIMISGARWMRARTPALKALFPNARIVEFYGASETSFVAWMDADEHAPAQAVGRPFSNVDISIRKPRESDDAGLIYLRSPMLFMNYVGEQADHTAVLRDGEWLSVRDMGHVDDTGMLHLAGRESRMIVTRGKNLFPEELENLLQEHPAIARASVQGVPDALRGMQLHAVIEWRAEAPQPAGAAQLTAWLKPRIEAFKIPRQWWHCREWPQTTSGKTHHQAIALALQAVLENAGTLLEPLPK